MAAKKGHKKIGGRAKGVENKTTRDIKEAYKNLVENNLDNIKTWLEKIAAKDPEKAVYIIINLSEYVLPKLARTESKIELEDNRKAIQSLFPDESELNG